MAAGPQQLYFFIARLYRDLRIFIVFPFIPLYHKLLLLCHPDTI